MCVYFRRESHRLITPELLPTIQRLYESLPKEVFAYTKRAYRKGEARAIALIPIAFQIYTSLDPCSDIQADDWVHKFSCATEYVSRFVPL